MRIRLISALAVVVCATGNVWAQAQDQSKAEAEWRENVLKGGADPQTLQALEWMRASVERMEAARRQRESEGCVSSGGEQVRVGAVTVFDGRTYRCVEVFEPDAAGGALSKRGVGLVRVTSAP